MPMSSTQRFAFTADGRPTDGPAGMNVTYVGRINRKLAEADARRRFEEWQSLPSLLARRWSSNQVVVR
ncbi:hypothetical protein [Magnetospirillum sulfuroxidans]|uniref:Uncharacterized protein n=1 Tax=Magnetospirillum sulfuroxidans TaxID=611300 RepID=A0ABS5I8D9_9PROT|nr:hypothetical protein [Magnetospirillum sulfuroxidans]MBR9970706.1 hypothetical protein [Magnetospirillum sulfuroxidans]